MSILIKGTKMPKTCEECQSTLGLFADECPLFAEFPKKFDYDPEIGNNRRYDGCPLVEVPPHGRLIDADKLELYPPAYYGLEYFSDGPDNVETMIDDEDIKEAPTVIESEDGDSND